jgi:hypothetical protein
VSQCGRKPELLVAFRCVEKVFPDTFELFALKFAGQVLVDYFVDDDIVLPGVLGIREQSKFQFLFFCLTERTKKVLF